MIITPFLNGIYRMVVFEFQGALHLLHYTPHNRMPSDIKGVDFIVEKNLTKNQIFVKQRTVLRFKAIVII